MTISNLNNAANQFVIDMGGIKYFQSYKQVHIRFVPFSKHITLYPNWAISKTTLRYVCTFLNKVCGLCVNSMEDIRNLIKEGKIIYSNELIYSL